MLYVNVEYCRNKGFPHEIDTYIRIIWRAF